MATLYDVPFSSQLNGTGVFYVSEVTSANNNNFKKYQMSVVPIQKVANIQKHYIDRPRIGCLRSDKHISVLERSLIG